MTTDATSLGARRTPAGEILGDELDKRRWTQTDFAAVLGRPTQFVSEIVNGRKEITRESAAQFSALHTSAEFWLRLQDGGLLGRQANDGATQRSLSDVRRRAILHDLAPIGLLQKRGLLTATRLDELEEQVKDLFEINDLEQQPAFKIAARRSNTDGPVSQAQFAWVACVRRAVRARSDIGTFSKKKLELLVRELPTTLKTPGGFRSLPTLFAAAGVALVYVEAFPGAKIDGCSMMLDRTPVIGLSGRGKRLDKVLFTLMHEAAHILLGHVKSEGIVESIDPHDTSDDETAANTQAGNWILGQPLPQTPPRVGAAWVKHLAAERGLAPIVIVGQLQNRGDLDWRTALAKNAPSVASELERWQPSS